MNFDKHSNLEGRHAFLSASKYHWINYTDDKLVNTFKNFLAIEKGTRLHGVAKELIDLKIKLPKSQKTLNLYVNDAIGFKMTPEQPLYFSENAFGTADAISFRKNFLRIHDLKTGASPASMEQLKIYEALFCLEYKIKPGEIESELRIYQNDEIFAYRPEADEILPIMDKIIRFDEIINNIKSEVN